MDDIEDAIRQPRFFEHLREEQRCAWVAFARLEDEGVAACQGYGEHPHRDHSGEVEGGDPCYDAERLPHGPAIDIGAYLFGVFSFEQLRDAGRELDHFETSSCLAFCIREDLAVLAGE